MTVPFGFSIGDFIAVGDLALRLYRQCYLVARNAPHEFQILTKELGTLHTTVLVLREEVADPDSVLVKSGEDRIRMVNEMIDRVKDTLNAMEKFAAKYGKLMDKDRAKWKHRWDKFKWSLEASELDGLRNKLIYHNGVLSLLLTSAGNSSLQRLESTSQKIESGVNEIKDYLQRSGTGDLSSPPTVTASVGDNLSKISFSQILMRNAEITSKWTSIGIEDWIRAGRWWLLKSQMELHSSNAVSRQGYLNLIKASWILVDIVVRHPQLSFLDSTIRLEVSLLTEAINGEFQRLKGLGLQLPGLDDLDSSSDDLRIWEAQVKGPSFQPGGKSKTQKSSWEVLDEHIHFQKFARYIYGQDHQQVPCLVLFLAHKKQKQARLVVYDQNWVTLAEFQAETLNRTSQARTEYVFPDPKIMLPHADDSKLLCILLEASEEHLAYDALPNNLETFYAFCLLIAIKRGASDCFERWFTDKRPSPPPVVPLLEQANNLEMRFRDHSPPKWKQDENLQGRSLVLWLVYNEFFEAARVLLEARNVLIPNDCDIFQLLSPLHSVTTGCHHVVKLLLEEGMNPNKTIPKRGGDSKSWTVLQVAAMGGHQAIVEQLLKAGADVNALPAAYRGRTALQATAGGGHQAVVEQLLKAGADVNALPAEHRGKTALQAAAKGGHQVVVEQLLKAGADVNALPAEYEKTALQAAAGGGHQAVVEQLLKAGADVNALPAAFMGRTALQAAASGGHQAVVEQLLKAGADVNALPADFGGTALQAAAGGGHQAVVEQLLKAGADVNALPAAFMGRTALQAAAAGGHQAVVEQLLKAGADVNALPPKYGETALQAAAAGGHEAVVEQLLRAGAKVSKDSGTLVLKLVEKMKNNANSLSGSTTAQMRACEHATSRCPTNCDAPPLSYPSRTVSMRNKRG